MQQGQSSGEWAFEQHLHGAATRLLAAQPCRNDASVVEHQQIAGLEQLDEITNAAIVEGRPTARVQNQQPRSRPLRQRPLRDQFLGQFEIEIGGVHGAHGRQVCAGFHVYCGPFQEPGWRNW